MSYERQCRWCAKKVSYDVGTTCCGYKADWCAECIEKYWLNPLRAVYRSSFYSRSDGCPNCMELEEEVL